MDENKLKLWLDFGKFFLGTFLIGFISLVINSGFENREIAIKESEQIGKYVEIALKEDVGVRKRFAEYFKTVSVSEKYRDRWNIYFDLVSLEFEQLKIEAKSVRNELDNLKSKVSEIDQNNLSDEEKLKDKKIYETKINDLEGKRKSIENELKVGTETVNIYDPFIIGLYSLNPSPSEKEKIKNYISQKDFYFNAEYDYDIKPDWMAEKSTVFYYSPSSEIQAEQIASVLKKLTGKKFDTKRGAGLGVVKGKEQVTFFIHNIN